MVKIFNQGEIVELDFGRAVGSEPQSKRPALVVSSTDFNVSTSMTLVCPITSADSRFPLHLALPEGLDTYGFVATEQVRAYDLAQRNARHIEQIDNESDFMKAIRELIRSFI